MDDLPPSLQLEILNRLNDSTDLARCRLASKTLNNLSYEIHSLKILYSYNQYLKSRTLETQSNITPFKLIVKKILFNLKNLETISIGFENSFPDHEDGFDQSDDLYMTSVDFLSEWLPKIAMNLKSISIVDLWIQSCWRESKVLSFVSSYCNHHLVELELKNNSISMEGLKPMLMLTSLTLEFIRLLDDEDLNKVNECFPCLRVLNLIDVGGLKQPMIHLLHLETCHWVVSKYVDSLTIDTPSLIDLELKCVKPKALMLKVKAPLLTSLRFSIDEVGEVFQVDKFLKLKFLEIESPDLFNLIKSWPVCNTVEKLVLDSPKRAECTKLDIIEKLVLDSPKLVSDVAMLVHRDIASNVRWRLICNCIGDFPRIRWKWGMWKEGQEDSWLCDGI